MDGRLADVYEVIIHTDGAARGNPGPAGAGWVIYGTDGRELEAGSLHLGVATNNVAEYRAVIEALQRAAALGARRVLLRSDSELLVNQLTNRYQVRNEGLVPLYQQVQQLSRTFEHVSFAYVPRAETRRAAQLASAAAAEGAAPVEQAVPADNKPAHLLRLRVRYGETDQMGVVYYANYFDWFTEARTALMRDSGVSYKELEERRIYLPVREANCEYLHPARYEDELTLYTVVTRLTPVRFDFAYEITKEGIASMCARGWTKHAFMDENGQPFNLRKRHPDIWERLQRAVEKFMVTSSG